MGRARLSKTTFEMWGIHFCSKILFKTVKKLTMHKHTQPEAEDPPWAAVAR